MQLKQNIKGYTAHTNLTCLTMVVYYSENKPGDALQQKHGEECGMMPWRPILRLSYWCPINVKTTILMLYHHFSLQQLTSRSTTMRSWNELHWPDCRTGHQVSSSNNDHQGNMFHWRTQQYDCSIPIAWSGAYNPKELYILQYWNAANRFTNPIFPHFLTW